MEGQKRNIDDVTSSMSVLQLNNMIVSLRKIMKKSKVRVIHKLIDQVKLYREKKGSDKQQSANKRKSERILQELEIIKKMDVDDAVKYALGNTQKVQDVSQNNLIGLILKCKVRLSCEKLIQDKVTKWREAHQDWRSLAAFIQQHSSRRLKRKKRQEEEESTEGKDSNNESDDEGSSSDEANSNDETEKGEKEKLSEGETDKGQLAILSEGDTEKVQQEELSEEMDQVSSKKTDNKLCVKKDKKIFREQKSNIKQNDNTTEVCKQENKTNKKDKTVIIEHNINKINDSNIDRKDFAGDEKESNSEQSLEDSNSAESDNEESESESETLSHDINLKENISENLSDDDLVSNDEGSDIDESNSENSDSGSEHSDSISDEEVGFKSSKPSNKNKKGNSIIKGSKKLKSLNEDSIGESKTKEGRDKVSSSVSRGELVVKRLNLNDFKDVVSVKEKDVSFLFQENVEPSSKSEESDKHRDIPEDDKSGRDPFFLMGSSDDEQVYRVHNQEESDKALSSDDEDLSDYKLKKAKKSLMAESTFIGSLSAKHVRNRAKNKGIKHRHGTEKRWQSKESGSGFKQQGKPIFNSKPDTNKGAKYTDKKQPPGSGTQKPGLEKAASEKLHPSWEASKKRKQEQNTIKQFQGKKIKFDD